MVLTCQILNFNDSKHTIELVEKIKKFDIIDYILIVDNCSTDGSFSLLKENFDNPKIKIVKTSSNKGYGSGNNYGIKLAYNELNSDYVLLANPDVNFSEEVLFKLIESMRHEKNICITAPTQRINKKVIRERAWKVPTKFEYIFSDTKLAKLIPLNSLYPDNYFSNVISDVDCVPGALLLINPKIFLMLGGFDERMFLYCEETTIGFKIKNAGYKTTILNQEFYDHIQSASIHKAIPSMIKQRRYIYNNRLIFLRDYLKARQLTIWLAQRVYNHILIRMSEAIEKNEGN